MLLACVCVCFAVTGIFSGFSGAPFPTFPLLMVYSVDGVGEG